MLQKFDYTKLCNRICEKYGTAEKFARVSGFKPVALSAKLNNAADFTQSEISRARVSLGIKAGEIAGFFFVKN